MFPCRKLSAWLSVAAALLHAPAALAAGPEVSSLMPAGGQQGTTVEVSAGGKLANWPLQAWIDRPGLEVAPAEEKGKLSVAIAADAAPGTYWIRLFDGEGASAPRPFIVGTLTEIVEHEPNDAPRSAQPVGSSRAVVNGRLGASGDVDMFAVPLGKGETLVASLAAHEPLGSPVDAVMHVVSAAGHQLAYNHDQRGLDPEIVYAAPADGDYLVRVFGFPAAPNQTIGFSGSETYVYRLTLTTGPFVDYPWPLAVTRGESSPVELVGWNIPESLSAVTIEPEGESHEIFDERLANVAIVAVEAHATIVEIEPNEPAAPQQIDLPVTISGRIEHSGDVDAFAFEAKKDRPLVFRIESRALGYPLDAVLQILDAENKSLSRVDDVGNDRDPVLTFSPPADGSFRVVVSDVNRHGSSRHVYRLRAAAAEPSFEVSADAHAYTISPDKSAEIALSIDRQHGFAEEIRLTAIDLPEGVSAEPAVSASKGESAKTVKLSLSTSGETFSGPFRIRAEAAGESGLVRTATAAIPNHMARTSHMWLTGIQGEAK